MTAQDLYLIADELRAMAATGLKFSENGYDRERYERLLEISARLVAAIEDRSVPQITAQYSANLDHISPFLCVESAVFREGKILLMQRRDDQRWAMPGGLVEVGESPAQAAERELWEEAGVYGKVIQLLGVYDSRFWPSPAPYQLCIMQFLMETDDVPFVRPAVEGVLSPLTETLAVDFFDETQLPEMHGGHGLRVPVAFKIMRGEIPLPYFDRK